ncbi:MAG: type II toxin-antitoxin system RelE/ParE family toxin [Desulfobacterales bacterium]|nr:type II toxin-antitoxin system RelE/ParE family toxin [Desulfobacterales bacterium]
MEDFYRYGSKAGIQPKHAEKLELILDRLAGATDIKDMRYPGSNLHKLNPKVADEAKRKWAVSVSGNWRIQFLFYNGNAHIVDYLDYH